MDFALDRKYNEEAQVMAMEMEGIDIAVLFPTLVPERPGPRRYGPATF